MHSHDLIVVGAGIFGIQAARTYLDIHPESDVVILEEDDHAGGTWSKTRSYPGFWSQTGLKLAEFSDRPLHLPEDAENKNNLFEAKHFSSYIEEYLDNHSYANKPLRARIMFSVHVEKVTRADDGWIITYMSADRHSSTMTAPKLVVASGHTSVPNIPKFVNDRFQGQIVHIKNFGRSDVLSGTPKRIAVIGGGKSAADMAYAAVKAGHDVSWIVRDSGHGPGLFAVCKPIAGYANPTDVAATRAAATMSPSFFNKPTWWTSFVHGTWLGKQLLMAMFGAVEKQTWEAAGFTTRTNTRGGFEKMQPQARGFWVNSAIGLIQVDDFWECIAENVQIHRSDISELNEKAICLENGTFVPCEAILLGTGFVRAYPFFDTQQHIELGLSQPKANGDAKIEAEWDRLYEEADEKAISQFPILKESPGYIKNHSTTPYRLYNVIAPLNNQPIAFVGCVSAANMFTAAEIQALWTTAYLDRQIDLPPIEERKAQVALDNAWSKRRYPYYGQTSGIDFSFEHVLYCDRLLKELGLSSHVQRSWRSYWFAPNYASTFKGVKDEYLAKMKKQI